MEKFQRLYGLDSEMAMANGNELCLVTETLGYEDLLDGTEWDLPFSVIDRLADEKTANGYLLEQTDEEFLLGDSENLDVEKMKADGWVGYCYEPEGDGIFEVCLFDRSLAKQHK